MKTCLCCGSTAISTASFCYNCGEGSWSVHVDVNAEAAAPTLTLEIPISDAPKKAGK